MRGPDLRAADGAAPASSDTCDERELIESCETRRAAPESASSRNCLFGGGGVSASGSMQIGCTSEVLRVDVDEANEALGKVEAGSSFVVDAYGFCLKFEKRVAPDFAEELASGGRSGRS